MVSFNDRFWAAAQLELTTLTKPDGVLSKLSVIHPKLHRRLQKADRWLSRENRAPHELEAGWKWWIKNYRRAIQLVEGDADAWRRP